MKLPVLLNLQGYTQHDPLDAPTFTKAWGLLSLVSIGFLGSFLWLATSLQWIHWQANNSTLFLLGILLYQIIASAVLFVLRKSSSIFLMVLYSVPLFLLELSLYHQGKIGNPVPCTWQLPYLSLPMLQILGSLLCLSVVSVLIALFFARILASIFFPSTATNPSSAAYQALFEQDWAYESLEKPQRDIGFWLLRLAGFGYLGFWAVMALGQLGVSAWPEQLQYMITMSNANDALAVNTFIKEWLMIMLAFLGAYNRQLRYYVCLILVAGHFFSTGFTLLFYLSEHPSISYRDYLLTSTFVEGSLLLIFVFVLIKYKKDRLLWTGQKDFPINYSIPLTLLRWTYIALTVIFFGIGLGILGTRLWANPTEGFGIIFAEPDPMVGNTITLFITLGTITCLLIKREDLRQHLNNLLIFPLVLGAIIACGWIVCSDISIINQYGVFKHIDWYLGLYAFFSLAVAGWVYYARQLYYRIDCSFNTLSAAAITNITALLDTLGAKDQRLTQHIDNYARFVTAIDQYVGGIRGRKRGLLNVPFGLLEHIFNTLWGMHPPFSSMAREEQRYFLQKYIFRNQAQRQRSTMPLLAELSYQIGLSLNALTGFAFFSNTTIRRQIGYVPVDARDRLQTDQPSQRPPFQHIADLPKDHLDKHNYAPVSNNPWLVAPRISTTVQEATMPSEVDYLIIGSGAGGASAAYRLVTCLKQKYTNAQGIIDEEAVRKAASKIVIVERGSRLQAYQDFQDNELEMMKKIYKEGGLQQTKQFTMTVLQGECVGGTTVSNNAVCFRMPKEIEQRWQQEYGIDTQAIAAEYDTIEAELHIRPLDDVGINQTVENLFKKGVQGYNATNAQTPLQTPAVVKVNHLHNIGDGNWNLGNKKLRKRSMLETYIPWAEAWGVKVVANWTAARFIPDAHNSKAEYVLLRADNGQTQLVKINKALIVSGGVIASSHFLMRSQVNNPLVGQEVSCNFGMPLAFRFADTLKAYDGEQITLYSHVLEPKQEAQKSVYFETYFNPPAAFALACMPFVFDKRDAFMQEYAKLLNFGALIGSENQGTIQAQADLLNGQAFSYTLGERDIERIKFAIKTLIALGKEAGALEVIIPTKPGVLLDLQNEARVNDFLQALEAYPLQTSDLFMGTAHPQGGNRMASNHYSQGKVVDTDFALEGFDNVFVADASVFPTSLGVNPQLTIMAMASLAAKKIFKRFEA